MASRPRVFTRGGITYLHERYNAPAGQRYIWDIPEAFGVQDGTAYGFEVIHERTLRFGAKAYELAGLHTGLLNAVITISNPNRDTWITNDKLSDFFGDVRNQVPPINSTYLARALDALDSMMHDASATDEPFIERGRRGSGYNIKLRLNPLIGLEDNRAPNDFDVPLTFD